MAVPERMRRRRDVVGDRYINKHPDLSTHPVREMMKFGVSTLDESLSSPRDHPRPSEQCSNTNFGGTIAPPNVVSVLF